MAREPRSLRGKVVAITGGARGIGRATATALVREGAKVAIGDLDRELAEQTAAELGGETIALELDVTRRDSLRALPRSGRGAARPARRARQQRRDHAARPVRRRERRDRAAADRHQRARRHLRDEAALPRMQRRGTRPHRQHRLAGGQGRLPRRRHLLRAPSTPSSASPRPSAPSCARPKIEISCVMPAVVNTELGSRPAETAGRQEAASPRTSPRRSSTRSRGRIRRLRAAQSGRHQQGR